MSRCCPQWHPAVVRRLKRHFRQRQFGEPDMPELPLLILKNNYVIDRETGDKLPISQEVIASVSQGFAENYGFACVGCSNFEFLPATKWSN